MLFYINILLCARVKITITSFHVLLSSYVLYFLSILDSFSKQQAFLMLLLWSLCSSFYHSLFFRSFSFVLFWLFLSFLSQGALEKAEQEEEQRRRSSIVPGSVSNIAGSSSRNSASVRISGSSRLSWPDSPSTVEGGGGGGRAGGKSMGSGRFSSGTGRSSGKGRPHKAGWRSAAARAEGDDGVEAVAERGSGAGAQDEDKSIIAYRRALAKVRRETIQEGLRQGQTKKEREGSGRYDHDG